MGNKELGGCKEEDMGKLTRKEGKNLQAATRLAKDRKLFQIWLIQPDGSKCNKGI